MKQLILIALVCFASVSQAQKFAYVDSDYILERIPEYASAEDQLEKLSVNWQSEIEEVYQQIDVLYKKYQADKILLTQEMKNKRESEIINNASPVAYSPPCLTSNRVKPSIYPRLPVHHSYRARASETV